MKSLPRFQDRELASTDLISEDGGSLPTLSAVDEVDLVGQSLNGTYIVESVIGEGGMGRVYQARHARIASKKLAIKVLRPEFARNAEVIARFRREAETAAGITHPNVIGVYDVDVTMDGHFYIVCEHLKGIDLAERLANQKRLDVPQAIHVILHVCRALEAAVARGVVHRDLKPHNVFLLADESGSVPDRPEVKVLDFGLSRVMDAPGTQLTQTGVIMGTPAYMAPEQAQGTGVDHQTDVYGVGAVLFTTLTGRPPYEAETLQGVVLAVLSGEPPLPRSLNPEIPENLELVIQRAMSRKKEDRYPNMTALREALEPFASMDERLADTPGKTTGHDLRALLQADARAVSLARPRLLMLGLVAIALLVVGLASVLPSLELLTGTLRFTRVEIGLALLAITGTLLTPGLLLMRLVRKTIWNNHSRVLELLETVRGALFWAIVSYGVGSLAVRFLADVASRFAVLPPIGRMAQSGWAGWNFLLLLVAIVMAAVTVMRYRLLRRGGIVGWLSPALFAGGLLVSALVLSFGFAWQKGSSERAGPIAAPSPVPAAEAPANVANRVDAPSRESVVTPPAGLPATPPSALPPPAPPRDLGPRATSAELSAASARGVDGLQPLAERYPNDPGVLRALLLAFAARANGLVDAMTVAKRLFEVAPEQAEDKDVRFLVKRGAATPGQSSTLAFPLMAESMGSTGPDLLYELTLSDARASVRADQLLATDAVKAKATPALLVANDLRKAASCSARVPLLERASAVGDERSATILAPLGASSKRGCGKKKKLPCPAQCPAEAERYLDTVATIRARVAAQPK
ncbi:MAG TPA: serine/threonine-protein kinase [Polyangiaceae bacterium]|nr:serine/threonine-protein kinase [Polyangiaceae bacterium]